MSKKMSKKNKHPTEVIDQHLLSKNMPESAELSENIRQNVRYIKKRELQRQILLRMIKPCDGDNSCLENSND